MSSSSTSLWVTKRTVRGIDRARADAGRGEAGDEVVRAARPDAAHTMLVRTVAGSTLPGPAFGERVGEPAGARVVVGEPLDHRLERDDARPPRSRRPGACRRRGAAAARAPRRSRRPGRTATTRPARSSPSTGRTSRCRRAATSSAGGVSERDRRVPDARAVDVHAQRRRRARARTSVAHLVGADRRARRRPCTCSRATSIETGGKWCARALERGARCRRARLHSGCICTPLFSGAAAASYRYTCGAAGHSTSVPGVRARGSRAGSPSCPTARRARLPCRAAPAASDSQPVDRRVLAVHVVADLGVGHRAPHLRRRRRDRVGAQLDVDRSCAWSPVGLHRADQAFLDHRDRERAVAAR